jgi:hypothetical protein
MPSPYTQSETPGGTLQPEQHANSVDTTVMGRQLLAALMLSQNRKTLQWKFNNIDLPVADLLVSEAFSQYSVGRSDQQ